MNLSLKELEIISQAQLVAKQLSAIYSQAQNVAENISQHNGNNANELLAQLNKDVNSRVASLIGNEIIKTEPVINNSVMLYKQKDGLNRWLGIHSNNYEDLHDQIISKNAHTNYVTLLQKNLIPFPDLWLWHKPLAIGTVDALGFSQDFGASFSTGVIFKQFEWVADLVKGSGVAWGMSHGMPRSLLEFNPIDKRVIERYIDREVSLLPLSEAASPLTRFAII